MMENAKMTTKAARLYLQEGQVRRFELGGSVGVERAERQGSVPSISPGPGL